MAVRFISHCDVVLACVTAAYRAAEAGGMAQSSLDLPGIHITAITEQNSPSLHTVSLHTDNMTYAAIIKNKDKRSLRKVRD